MLREGSNAAGSNRGNSRSVDFAIALERTGEAVSYLMPQNGRRPRVALGRIFAFVLARSTTGASRAWSRRFRDSVLQGTGLGSPSAQPPLVIALSERHTPRAQDVVCGDGVEIEVGQRKRKDEGLRRER
jgi:hypothetical protein